MPTNDDTPEITNPPYVIVTNHKEVYRDGRFEPLVPHPPLPAEFVAWLAAARQAGHYRVNRPLIGPDPRTDVGPRMHFPREYLPGTGPIWASPPPPRMWSTSTGYAIDPSGQRMPRPVEATPRMLGWADLHKDVRARLDRVAGLRERVLAGIRAHLIAIYAQADRMHTPVPGGVNADGHTVCSTCGLPTARGGQRHGRDELFD